MMITRQYRPVAAPQQALPVNVTIGVSFVQFDVRNPDISLRTPFAQIRIESDTYDGVKVWKVAGEASKDQWWRITLNAEDGAELAGLITEANAAVQRL